MSLGIEPNWYLKNLVFQLVGHNLVVELVDKLHNGNVWRLANIWQDVSTVVNVRNMVHTGLELVPWLHTGYRFEWELPIGACPQIVGIVDGDLVAMRLLLVVF